MSKLIKIKNKIEDFKNTNLKKDLESRLNIFKKNIKDNILNYKKIENYIFLISNLDNKILNEEIYEIKNLKENFFTKTLEKLNTDDLNQLVELNNSSLKIKDKLSKSYTEINSVWLEYSKVILNKHNRFLSIGQIINFKDIGKFKETLDKLRFKLSKLIEDNEVLKEIKEHISNLEQLFKDFNLNEKQLNFLEKIPKNECTLDNIFDPEIMQWIKDYPELQKKLTLNL